ncbi:hypothetical protein NX059_005490 [Plenodomus lindquistii]|nr:hypothetical protein NX059_005490 [Plenodomus lindquistii]
MVSLVEETTSSVEVDSMLDTPLDAAPPVLAIEVVVAVREDTSDDWSVISEEATKESSEKVEEPELTEVTVKLGAVPPTDVASEMVSELSVEAELEKSESVIEP